MTQTNTDKTVSTEELRKMLRGLEGVTPGVMGAIVSAMGSRRRRYADMGAPEEQASSDFDCAVWLADNLSKIRAALRAASITPPAPEPGWARQAVEHIDTLSELLKIIKEHWIDYDHVFSIAVDEADKFVAARTTLNNTPETQ